MHRFFDLFDSPDPQPFHSNYYIKMASPLEQYIAELRLKLEHAEADLRAETAASKSEKQIENEMFKLCNLSFYDITRYSRQMILPFFSASTQERLARTSVLIVGVGGLGCPVAIQLASSGIGRLGLLDFDEVDLSNLPRQYCHTEKNIGMKKVHSIKLLLQEINSRCEYDEIPFNLFDKAHEKLILDKVNQYDIILDCTDNIPTRYFLNDLCILYNKPFITGAAVNLQGQVNFFHSSSASSPSSPCYRCIHPLPPPLDTVQHCSDIGVLSPITTMVGSMQVMQVFAYVIRECVKDKSLDLDTSIIPELLLQKIALIDLQTIKFRTVPLRNRSDNCISCSLSLERRAIKTPKASIDWCIDHGLIKREEDACECIKDSPSDVGRAQSVPSINASDFYRYLQDQTSSNTASTSVVLDIRPESHVSIFSIKHSVQMPMEKFMPFMYIHRDRKRANDSFPADDEDGVCQCVKELTQYQQIYVICRRGNDSLLVSDFLCNKFGLPCINVKGGFEALHSDMCKDMIPKY
jgi:adenylyltransferase and sulfurtransferase